MVLKCYEDWIKVLRFFFVEFGRFIFCGLCFKSLRLSYWYGELVCIMLKEIVNFKVKGVFFECVVGLVIMDMMEKKFLDLNMGKI